MTRPDDAFIAIDGETYRLRLTLGALAEIEQGLGGDVKTMGERLARPRVADILMVLRALIGGGGGELSLKALKDAHIDFADAADAISRALAPVASDAQEDGAGGPFGQAPGKRRARPGRGT